jgi:hypothetical protein
MDISLPELRNALLLMNNNASPGAFGIEVECL